MGYFKSFLQKKRYLMIVIAWLVIALICLLYLPYSGHPFKMGAINDSTVESTQGQDIIINNLPYSGSSLFILFESKSLTVNDPTFEAYINKTISKLKNTSFKNRIISPYQNAKQISSNKHAAYVVIDTDLTSDKLAISLDEIKTALGKSKKIQTYLGGEAAFVANINELSKQNLIRGELIALPICFIIMIFVFGGWVAACITILSGVVGIIIITTILYLLGHYIDLSIYVLNIATMLGLGLCLDYTLLITYRFREEWPCFNKCNPTLRITLVNSGRAVIFSGLIVLISIASLMFFPINVLRSMGIAGVIIVTITMLCSLTFLPAMLCLFANAIVGSQPVKNPGMIEEQNNDKGWYRFALLVMKHPVMFLIPTIIILLLLGYLFLNVNLNNSNAKILPPAVESRIFFDKFDEYFDSNQLEPIVIVLTAKNKSILSKDNISALYDYTQNLKKDHRVKSISSIVTIRPGLNKQAYQQLYQMSKLPFDDYENHLFKKSTKNKYTVITVVSKYSKDDKRNFELVAKIRNNKMGNGIAKKVTGFTAKTIDSIHGAYSLLFKIVIFISFITYLALVWLLRSLILPLKAIIMNFLSLSVCYGMLVFIFQEGHFADLLNFQPGGFTDMNLPILIFFVLFGLSMDYEIFLLTRIQEYYKKTGDNTISVALGLEKSARIITSAAIILVVVTGAFVTADLIFIKAFGLGTALAIIVDTTLIRLILVPSTMRLLGEWNWYIPKWLDRLLPNINFEQEPVCHLPENKPLK